MKRSELGLGTWQFGPSHGFWTETGGEKAQTLVRFALAQGIRHIDTAPAYGNGLSEQRIGSVLASLPNRKELHLSTKFMPKTVKTVRQDVLKSLGRLKTDYLDTLYLHWPSSTISLKPILKTAHELVEEGLVRALGLCNTPLTLLNTLDDIPFSFLQVPCSLLWTRDLAETRAYAKERSIELVGYSPLGLGLLGGNHREKPEDGRASLYVYASDVYPTFLELLDTMGELASKKGCSSAQLALLWAQSQDFSTILVGARSTQQLAESLSCAKLVLDVDEKSVLDEMAGRLAAHIPASCDNLFGYRW